MVVPRSSNKLHEDSEYGLYSVTVFKKVVDEYKHHAREKKYVHHIKSTDFDSTPLFPCRFIVREFVYDPRAIAAEKNEKGKLEMQLKKQFVSVCMYCYSTFITSQIKKISCQLLNYRGTLPRKHNTL